jgi:rhamnose utilization protein RhaD (predicted bifunctional aldolase and dehydrogenase)
MPENLWNPKDAPKSDGLSSLAYRSRLLGADRTLVNIYGGNTSTKSLEKDHLGRDVMVLWVKGSGSDIADITERGFAGLKLEEVLPLFDRSSMSDEDMVAFLDRTAFEVGRPQHRDVAARFRSGEACRSHAPGCDHQHRVQSQWQTHHARDLW